GPARPSVWTSRSDTGLRLTITRVMKRFSNIWRGGSPASMRAGARRRGVAGLVLVATTLAGCDGLFDVELPGQLVSRDLNDPALAETLALGVQGDFECAFRGYLARDVNWSGVYTYVSGLFNWFRSEQRSRGTEEGGTGTCEDNREPVWLPLHTVRKQAETAIELIQSFPEGSVDTPALHLARAALYGAYATQLLSEHYCGIVFGGDGVVRSREFGF